MEGGVTGSPRDSAWRVLHDRHVAELRRYVLHLTHDRQWGEDVVQEVLVRAWREDRLAGRDDDAVRAWLFTVARRLVIDKWRSAAVRRELPTAEVTQTPTADQTEQVLDRWLIADALSSLTPEHRAVVVAAYYQGQQVADIAERLQIAPGTVKSRLHYGLRNLRLILQEKGVTRS